MGFTKRALAILLALVMIFGQFGEISALTAFADEEQTVESEVLENESEQTPDETETNEQLDTDSSETETIEEIPSVVEEEPEPEPQQVVEVAAEIIAEETPVVEQEAETVTEPTPIDTATELVTDPVEEPNTPVQVQESEPGDEEPSTPEQVPENELGDEEPNTPVQVQENEPGEPEEQPVTEQTETEQETTVDICDFLKASGIFPSTVRTSYDEVSKECEGYEIFLAFDLCFYENEADLNSGAEWSQDNGTISVLYTGNAFSDAGVKLYTASGDGLAEKSFSKDSSGVTYIFVPGETIVIAKPITTNTISTDESSDCIVSVTYDSTCGIPMTGVKVIAKEIESGSKEYTDYAERSADKVEADENDSKEVRAFDIRIVSCEDERVEYEPCGEVSVSIKLKDVDFAECKDVSVLHFGEDEPEVMDGEMKENGLEFQTDGFSIYTIVIVNPIIPSYDGATSLLDFADAAFRMSVSVTSGKVWYFKSETNTQTSGFVLISKTLDESEAALWHVEPIDGTDEFYLYYLNGDTPMYIHVDQVWNTKFSFSASQKTAFKSELYSDGSGAFYIYLVYNNYNYAFNMKQKDAGKGFQLYKANNGTDTGTKVVITVDNESAPPTDPLELDGKTYGIMNRRTSTMGFGMLSEEFTYSTRHLTRYKEMLVRQDPMNRTQNLFVANNSDIAMWTFHAVDGYVYQVSTTVEGVEKYLRIDGNNIMLTDTPDEKCDLTLTAGIGDRAGMIRFENAGKSLVAVNTTNAKGFSAATDTSSNSWMNLVEYSVYSESDFIPYTAMKISASDTTKLVNGAKVILYTRVWNDSKKAYEFFAVDHQGCLANVYETGDSIVWVGVEVNDLAWEFTEYYHEGTNTPNYYYELQNTYSHQYIAPQLGSDGSGQILSDNKIGINMNGRKFGDYYTTIIAWDDPHYDYAGLKTQNGRVVAVPMTQAEDFYFAIIEENDSTQLNEVETVDHVSAGMTMKMINFTNTEVNESGASLSPTSQQQFDVMGEHVYTGANGGPTTGLLSTDIKGDGYPVATNTGLSLGNLFSSATDVNHLFIQSIYDSSGYYQYDSSQNFAHLESNGDFTVYQELGAVAGTSGTRKHGQFMPYNMIDKNTPHPTNYENLTDIYGNELPETDARKYETMYAFTEAEDHYFGLEISGDFMQTPSGKDAWGHDLVFDFVGDDDFWLYVDGELVIDLGGIHRALGASVNYSTGKVIVHNRETTLYDIFKGHYATEHGLSPDDPAVTTYLNGIFRDNGKTVSVGGVQKPQYVFKDYSTHSIRIFYMERGAGASNLRMRFNLATVKPGQVILSKEVSGTDKQDYASTVFPFQVFYDVGNGNGCIYPLYPDPNAPKPITIKYQNTSVDVDYYANYVIDGVNYTNIFLLKPGQTAVMDVPDDTIEYRIIECGVNTHIYDVVSANGDVLTAIPDSPSTASYECSADSVRDRVQVVFDNHVDPQSLRTLTIIKTLVDADDVPLSASDDSTGFRLRLYLGDNLDPYSLGEYKVKDENGHYCVFDASVGDFVSTGQTLFENLTTAQKERAVFISSPNGAIDKIKSGYSVEVDDLIIGTKFKVEEKQDDIPKGYQLVGYSRVGGSFISGESDNSGYIRDNSDPAIEINNKRGWGITANKVWTDNSFIESHDPIYIAVYAGNNLVAGTVRELSGTSSYYFIDALASGMTFADYTVKEVDVENPVVDANGNVTSYDSITPAANGDLVQISAVPLGESSSQPFDYVVEYTQGQATGDGLNVRTDKITNTRRNGVKLQLMQADGTTPLAGAAFELKHGNDPVGAGTYTTGSDGIITILYDFEADETYTLTQLSTASGFKAVTLPLDITISGAGVVSATGMASPDFSVTQASSGTMASVTVKNKAITFTVLKVSSHNGDLLEGAVFALYRGVEGVNGQIRRDFYPISGYDALTSDANGVVEDVDETLAPGHYYLLEKQAPHGFIRMTDEIHFEIGADGSITVLSSGHSGYLTTSDTSTTVAYTMTLPNTFDAGSIVPTGVEIDLVPGLVVMAAAALIVIVLRKRKSKSETA